ncbi:MAG: hypothetical protein JNL34_12435 [Anaerolineae bacterium]|nr:hypothetical protein [Anaerolineae bacterium]
MTPIPPLPDAGDSDSNSVFDDFINRNLDLNGLEPDDNGEVASSGLQIHSDGQGRIFLELPGPGSMPHANAPRVDGSPFSTSLGSLRMPYEHDARWTQMVMRHRPDKLRIHRAQVSFSSYTGQLILSLPARANRQISVISDIRPGWTAVRYSPGRETPAELLEWQGNRAATHHLKVSFHTVSGYVKDEEMPSLRPARRWEQFVGTIDFPALLIFFGALLFVLLLALAFVGTRLPLGNDPATVELQNQMNALQEQVATLEAALEGAALVNGR